jgi:integrase
VQKPTYRRPWNKDEVIGIRRPFTMEQVQLIRAALTAKNDIRGIALFETALSTCLRSCDLLRLRIQDVVSQGEVVLYFIAKQRKTKTSVRCNLLPKARAALAAWIALKKLELPAERLWKLDRRRYGQLVKSWAAMAYLDPRFYSTHSMRRTRPTYIHKQTGSHEIPRKMLGHANLARTSVYLSVGEQDVADVLQQYDM